MDRYKVGDLIYLSQMDEYYLIYGTNNDIGSNRDYITLCLTTGENQVQLIQKEVDTDPTVYIIG